METASIRAQRRASAKEAAVGLLRRPAGISNSRVHWELDASGALKAGLLIQREVKNLGGDIWWLTDFGSELNLLRERAATIAGAHFDGTPTGPYVSATTPIVLVVGEWFVWNGESTDSYLFSPVRELIGLAPSANAAVLVLTTQHPDAVPSSLWDDEPFIAAEELTPTA